MANRDEDETVEIENVEVMNETDRAILCDIAGEEVWIPKSQIVKRNGSVRRIGDEGTLVITRWIAEQKHLV